MSKKESIRSQSRFLWLLLLEILKFPFVLVMVLLRKREADDLFRPMKLILEYIVEARFIFTIVLVNIAVFIWMAFTPEATVNNLLQYPKDLFSPRIWTIFTAGFMHANLTHILGNMLIFFTCGRVVEKEFGSAKTALIYFGALIISGVFSSVINLFLMNDNTPGLGASGAIMGIVATAVLLHPFTITYEAIIPLPMMFIGWIAIWADLTGIINPTADGIGHFAHLGGFLSIALLAFILGEDKQKLWKGLLINIGCLSLGAILWFFLLR